jgi:hypothetical protein
MSAKPDYAEIKSDPDWMAGVAKLSWNKSHYGGVFLSGDCPTCQHLNGINVFVPTTWATGDDGQSAPSTLSTPATLKTLELDDERATVSDSNPAMSKRSNSAPPLEVVLCQCNEVHENTAKGKTGCGRWGYVVVKEGSRS